MDVNARVECFFPETLQIQSQNYKTLLMYYFKLHRYSAQLKIMPHTIKPFIKIWFENRKIRGKTRDRSHDENKFKIKYISFIFIMTIDFYFLKMFRTLNFTYLLYNFVTFYVVVN